MEKTAKVRNKLRIVRLSKAAWFKLEIGGKVLHIDPGYIGNFHSQHIPEEELQKKADYLFITHPHKDHLQPTALGKILDHSSQIVASKSCLGKIGRPFQTVRPGDHITVDGITVQTLPAYNTVEGNSTSKVHTNSDFVGYLIVIDGWRIYFAGDTDLIPEMKKLGYIDIAFLPIGGTFVMDWKEAVQAALLIRPQHVFPMHETHTDPQLFQEEMKRRSHIRPTSLRVGESVILN